MEIEQNIWGVTPEGEAVILYTMRNASGAEVTLTNYGAALVSATVPDREGRLADVVLGYPKYEDYALEGACMGRTVGRVANRIGNGVFTLDDIEYRFARNSPPNHLHGGTGGFAWQVWQSRVETNRVVMGLLSVDGDQGYPGEVGAEVVYDWDDECNLEITFYARSDRATVLNMTNHAYFNLAGESAGSVLDHELQLDAGRFLVTDRTQVPTGELADVEGTPMDFRIAKPLGRDIEADYEPLKIGFGYDHCWAVDGWEKGFVKRAARLRDPGSGRTLTVSSSHPGVQVYTGNFLAGGPPGKSGRAYADRDGVAIECQGFPNAVNIPQFPSQRVEADEVYHQMIRYRFGVE